MQYRLRTLMIVLALGPPVLALCWLRLDLALSFVILFAEVYFLLWFVHRQEMKSLQRARVEELIRKSDEFQKEIEAKMAEITKQAKWPPSEPATLFDP